jgi:chromosome partitioning protein
MKQIAIYSPKGGVGRTTLSLHLADRLTASGRHVFLRDQDPQASALAFALLADQAGAPLQFTVGRGVPPQGTDITLCRSDHRCGGYGWRIVFGRTSHA